MAAQEDAGLDLLSDGLLRWQDHFRPLVDASEGLDARPLTRFLDTNTFYRAVLVDGEPRLGTPLPAPDLPEGRWLATLPSPLAFARAANGAISAEALAANVLAPQIDAYAEAGCSLVVLWDPFLAREPDALDQARPALAELPRSVRIALHLAFGDAEAVLPGLADAPVDAIGVDFYATRVEAVPEGFPKELLAGVIDSRTSALEEPAEIARFRDAVSERVASSVALVPNGDLQFVPEPIARAKLACLGHARISEGVPA